MNDETEDKSLFLLDQRLSQLNLTQADKQQEYLFGEKAGEDSQWTERTRSELTTEAASASAPPRTILMCDAGRGKTTNMEWLQAAIVGEIGGQQVPFLIRIDLPSHVKLLQQVFDGSKRLLDWIAAEVAGGDEEQETRALQAVRRKRAQGRITLLIDGLDHVPGG